MTICSLQSNGAIALSVSVALHLLILLTLQPQTRAEATTQISAQPTIAVALQTSTPVQTAPNQEQTAIKPEPSEPLVEPQQTQAKVSANSHTQPLPVKKIDRPTTAQKPTTPAPQTTALLTPTAPTLRTVSASAAINLQQPASPLSAEQTHEQLKTAYLALLASAIQQQQRYPKKSRQRAEEGSVMLNLSINQQGELLAIEIIESSRFSRLDREATRMVRGASPFPPVPPELGTTMLELHLPIRFALTD